MNVVGHQDVGMYRDAMPAHGMPDQVQEAEPVLRCAEDDLAIVAALNDVQRNVWCEEAWLAGHATSIAPAGLDLPSAE